MDIMSINNHPIQTLSISHAHLQVSGNIFLLEINLFDVNTPQTADISLLLYVHSSLNCLLGNSPMFSFLFPPVRLNEDLCDVFSSHHTLSRIPAPPRLVMND
jgi:hypothetical protein